MIITRTPMRLSLLGGGSDLPRFTQFNNGRVIGMAIDKYMYITVHNSFDDNFKVSYNKVEINKDYKQLYNTRAVACIEKHWKVWDGKEFSYPPIEIHSISDMPSNGSGLGASSAYTVGLIHALKYKTQYVTHKSLLANSAIYIELEKLNLKIGMQDQVLSSYGGMNYIIFGKDNLFNVISIDIDSITLSMNDLMLFYVDNRIYSSDEIFDDINNDNKPFLTQINASKELSELAETGLMYLYNKNMKAFYSLIGESWDKKKQLSKYITNNNVDNAIDIAYKNGAIGCKLCGAGSGGFVLATSMYENDRKNIIKNMEENGYKYYPINIDKDGSKVIYPR